MSHPNANDELTEDFKPIGLLAYLVLDLAEEYAATRGQMRGLRTGIDSVDRITGGLVTGLIGLASNHPLNALTLALNITENVSLVERLPVAFFSLRSSETEITRQLMAEMTRTTPNLIRAGLFTDAEHVRLTEAIEALKISELYIHSSAALTTQTIRAKARALAHGVGKPSLIVVDALELFANHGLDDVQRGKNNKTVCRDLKLLAKEMCCPLLLLSQLKCVDRLQSYDVGEAVMQCADLVMRLDMNRSLSENAAMATTSPRLSVLKATDGSLASVQLEVKHEAFGFMDAH